MYIRLALYVYTSRILRIYVSVLTIYILCLVEKHKNLKKSKKTSHLTRAGVIS